MNRMHGRLYILYAIVRALMILSPALAAFRLCEDAFNEKNLASGWHNEEFPRDIQAGQSHQVNLAKACQVREAWPSVSRLMNHLLI